jgi:hypothetical protein
VALDDLTPEVITTADSVWLRFTLGVRRRPVDDAWVVEVNGAEGSQGAFTMGDESKVRGFIYRVLDRLNEASAPTAG